MTKVSKNGITVEIQTETIRHRLERIALHAIALEIVADLAQELGMSEAIIEDTLIRVFDFCLRTKVVKGNLDFEIPAHTDSAEQVKAKFTKILDSQYVLLIDEANIAIDAMDNGQDVALAPTPLPDSADEKQKKKEQASSGT
jgi:D-Tyr-tRNAtyr deacylase